MVLVVSNLRRGGVGPVQKQALAKHKRSRSENRPYLDCAPQRTNCALRDEKLDDLLFLPGDKQPRLL
jgi:hypothetical protein